eukprot:Gb_28209 [translate_table: standard]
MVGHDCGFRVSSQPGLKLLGSWHPIVPRGPRMACNGQDYDRCSTGRTTGHKTRVAANAMYAVIIVVMMLLGGAMAAEVAQSPSPTPDTGAAAAAIFAPSMAAAMVASLVAFLFF